MNKIALKLNSTLKNESVDTSRAKFRVREVGELTSTVNDGRELNFEFGKSVESRKIKVG